MNYHQKRMSAGIASIRAAKATMAAKNVTDTSVVGWRPTATIVNVGTAGQQAQDNATLAAIYSKSDLVRACIDEKASSIAEGVLEIGVDTPDGFEAIENHELLKLFYENPYYSYSDLWRLIVGRLDTTGAAFNQLDQFVNRIGTGGFTPIPTHLVTMKTSGPVVLGYEIKGDEGKPMMLEPKEMCAMLYHDLGTFQGFSSPLATALREYNIDVERSMITLESLVNKDIPGMIFESDANVNNDQRLQFKEALRGATGGDNGSRAKSILLPKGIHEKGGERANDINFSALNFLTETRICMVLGVPPIVIQCAAGLEKSTYSNYEEARRSFYRESVVSQWKFISSQLTRALLMGTGTRFKFNTDDIQELQADKNDAFKRSVEMYKAGIVTKDEARAIVELEPATEDGSTFFSAPAPVVAAPVEATEDLEGKADKPPKKAPAAIEGFDDATELENTLKAEFARQQAEVAIILSKGMAVDMALIGKETGPVISMTLESIVGRNYKKALAKLGADAVTVENSFNVVLPTLRNAVAKQAIQISDATLTTTGKSLEETISKIRSSLVSAGIEGDNTSAAITKALTEGSDRIFDNAKDFRARRIAVTESSRSQHSAQVYAARDSGIVQGFEFVISSDACELCQVYDKENKPTGKALAPYTNMNDALAQLDRYEDRTVPAIHPNCRCTQVPVFIDETPPAESMVKAEQFGRRMPETPHSRPGGNKPHAEPIDQFVREVTEAAQ